MLGLPSWVTHQLENSFLLFVEDDDENKNGTRNLSLVEILSYQKGKVGKTLLLIFSFVFFSVAMRANL